MMRLALVSLLLASPCWAGLGGLSRVPRNVVRFPPQFVEVTTLTGDFCSSDDCAVEVVSPDWSLTITHTVSNVPGRILLISGSQNTANPTPGSTGLDFASVLVNGVAATSVASVGVTTQAGGAPGTRTAMWTFINPPVGSNTVLFVAAGGTQITGTRKTTLAVETWSNVDTLIPQTVNNTATGTGTNSTFPVATKECDTVQSTLGSRSNHTQTLGTGMTRSYGVLVSNGGGGGEVCQGSGGYIRAAASGVVDWDDAAGDDGEWAMIGVTLLRPRVYWMRPR